MTPSPGAVGGDRDKGARACLSSSGIQSWRQGNADIDAQHRRLFELAATLESACTGVCAQDDRVAEAVYALAEYVVEHFRGEETFMASCGYPGAGPHAAQHGYLAGRAVQFTASYMNGEEPSPESLGRFVTEWLTEHILKEDMRIVAFARSAA